MAIVAIVARGGADIGVIGNMLVVLIAGWRVAGEAGTCVHQFGGCGMAVAATGKGVGLPGIIL